MWYVIQVETGKEERIRQLIEAVVPPALYEECRIIEKEMKMKIRGETRMVRRRVFPGYLFLVTSQISEAREYLKTIPELTKVLGYGGELVPIHKKEEEILSSLINRENLIEMSYAVKEGDRIRVTEGALKGREFLIRHINRHKMTGYIELNILGETRKIPIGLETVEVLPGPQAFGETEQSRQT